VQLLGMVSLVSQRLNEGFGAGGPVFYPAVEIVAALNEANRFFCLLTLGLEKTTAWPVPAATTFFHMLQAVDAGGNLIFPDWLVPLRITTVAGAKVRPGRFSELWALDSQWPQSPGAPYRYAAMGADLLAIYGQPAGAGTVLNVTYARAPLALVGDTDIPETPQEYHPAYVSYAINRMRQVEGGEPFAATLPLLAEFLEAATEYAGFVRARNIGAGYDVLPLELGLFDRSRLLGTSKKKG
jgi:hypothetical protein